LCMMASPLSPKANATLNATTPSTTSRQNIYIEDIYNSNAEQEDMDDLPSSPFVANVSENPESENLSPIKLQVSSQGPAEQQETSSPLKMLKSRANMKPAPQSPTKLTGNQRSPRKFSSPEKRFPVKVSLSTEAKSPTKEKNITSSDLFDRLVANDDGLKKAIDILEDEDTILEGNGVSDGTLQSIEGDFEKDGFADETAFSTFSAVPDMTMFAKIGHSPTRFAAMGQAPRRANGFETPATAHRPTVYEHTESPTPRRGREDGNSGNTTNLILDFTEQFNSLSGSGLGYPSPSRRDRQSPTKSKTVPDLFSYTQSARTPSPSKQRQHHYSPGSRMSNLLDFDIPPAPTPRSMPTITPRELESLKSGFLSEISSLKASLSGKEAEVQSLKTAVGDAEKRVGECLEKVREERNLKDQLVIEKEGWEKRGREMEVVLRNVKEEILHGERERDSLEGRLEESEKRREAVELMAQEAESKMAAMRAGSVSTTDGNSDDKKAHTGAESREVEVAVEKVARELHTLYKSKHETKVAALKKSYEGRWDKKVRDLEGKVEDLSRENEELRIGRDATMSGVVPRISSSDITEEMRLQAAADAKAVKEMEASVRGLSEEVKSVKRDNAELRQELEQERVEKGELVAACDELLALQEAAPTSHPAVNSGVENLRGSISRASGLRAPNFNSGSGIPKNSGESRIGRVERGRSGSAQGSRPGSGLGLRSGIMSSIEKMGSYKGRAD
jgi:hypothetical protein